MSPELKDLLLKVFYYFTSITAITGAIIYIAKISIKFYIDNKVEKYKSNLSKELEKFKSELKLIEIKSQISYNKLHEERATAIKNLYNLSLNLFDSIFNLTQPSQGLDWYEKQYNEHMFSSLKKFQQNYTANKIYLEKSLCEKIDNLISKCFEIHSEMESAKILASSSNKFERNESIKIWINNFNVFMNDLQIINNELIDEYRKILGVQ